MLYGATGQLSRIEYKVPGSCTAGDFSISGLYKRSCNIQHSKITRVTPHHRHFSLYPSLTSDTASLLRQLRIVLRFY
jgi:hypothetical protein